ncbi:hypothetical protein [Streptomyces sp. NBC_01465]|uniref:hypothetical protein n=1 Tax=Streptomyces sp. NBC_01465 TaxID=2903878 RepID=UPI002E2EEA8E|nr:hypothetical protein [Streptomyces sp. NBC_01465]
MGAFAVAAATVVVLVVAYAVGAPPDVVLGVGAAVLGLLWLLLLLTTPWNIYFRARSVLAEIAISRNKGLVVSAERDAEARRIARMMLRVAVSGHVVTAALLLATGLAAQRVLGYWCAGFFLLSTAFRPAGAYFEQLRQRLGLLLREVKYPRDDVVELRTRVEHVLTGMRVLEDKTEEQYRTLAELRRAHDALTHTAYQQADEADRRITGLARQFEQTVDGLTDNEEIITGLKAFVRLLRSGQPVQGPIDAQ